MSVKAMGAGKMERKLIADKF